MWGFSMEDLARRAQEEAAKLAEQVSEQASTMQSPAGLFNLDAMNPDAPPEPQVPDATVSTTTQSDISEANGFVTPAKQPNQQQVTGGRDDRAPGSSQISSQLKATKLSVSATSGDDFFDSSWDGDENNADQDDTDAAAERLRKESRLQAERIMLEEQQRRKDERERLEAERAENLKREQEAEVEQQRKEEAEAARIEAERLEQERLAAEEEARKEAERLEQERIERELELKRQQEAEAARIEAERLEKERHRA
ncbi:hypothetical protein THAOC_18584, partial [Thalassiosira oceanica]